MKIITNGHSEDNAFLSDNLTSLLEWCLNYKKNAYFIIDTPNTYYNVEIKYDKVVSEGWYLRDSYYCCLDIFITNKEGKCIQETLIINDDDWCLDDAVEEFNLNYLIAPIREFGE